jgi:hypothetical protein
VEARRFEAGDIEESNPCMSSVSLNMCHIPDAVWARLSPDGRAHDCGSLFSPEHAELVDAEHG